MQKLQRFALVHARQAWFLVALMWGLAVVGDTLHVWRFRALTAPLIASFMFLALVLVWARWRRERLVREAPIPQYLKRKLCETYPHLSRKDAELVERGLRQFFLACLRSNRQFVAMPSRAVDAMWHEFILHTQAYRDWCDLALGRFLHHTPAEVLGPQAKHNDGLRRAWYWACRDEGIKPGQPSRLPLLFALDAKLQIANGFRYEPDCRAIKAAGEAGAGIYCGTDFADGGYSGDADGFGGMDSSDASGGDGGADGGGGDGCGGGCGGGGD